MGSVGGEAVDSGGGRVVGGDGVGAWVDVGNEKWKRFSGDGSEGGKSVWEVGGAADRRDKGVKGLRG